MLAGDQHLGTIFHHGIDDWNDAGYSFCVPSVANLYLRWWRPLKPGKNRKKGMPDYTGEHMDGFNNKITCYAAANPDDDKLTSGEKLTVRSAGFGVVRYKKSSRNITMECWPRKVDVTDKKTKQYPGWPLTINQLDNYGRKAVAFLPEIKVKGMMDPVVQIMNEKTKEVVYTLRIKGSSFKAKVFNKGPFTVRVGELGEKEKTFKGVKPASRKSKPLLVEL